MGEGIVRHGLFSSRLHEVDELLCHALVRQRPTDSAPIPDTFFAVGVELFLIVHPSPKDFRKSDCRKPTVEHFLILRSVRSTVVDGPLNFGDATLTHGAKKLPLPSAFVTRSDVPAVFLGAPDPGVRELNNLGGPGLAPSAVPHVFCSLSLSLSD